jgi:biopolymer transport protein ExbD
MGRAKLPRKSTNIDMTAMCDVAFLLLSFFILATKAKPPEAIHVTPPTSVAAKKVPQKDVVLVTLDPSGKVFISMDNVDKKEFIANSIKGTTNPALDVKAFTKATFWGAPFAGINSFLSIPEEKRTGSALPGIPVDTTKGPNEMVEWMRLIKTAYAGEKINLLLKGDNEAKYPAFRAIVDAFKSNDLLKFQMVTNPEAAPAGTELWKIWNSGDKSARAEE